MNHARDSGHICEPPYYPADAFKSESEIAALQRECSTYRALSPGDRVCALDNFLLEHLDDPLGHLHPTDELMEYRYQHVIGPGEPWSYWLLYDEWLKYYTPPPPAPAPVPITGWQYLARVNERGIPFMTNWSGNLAGYTLSVHIGPSRIAKIGPGQKLRVTLLGDCTFSKVLIGPAAAPFVAQQLFPLTFGGGTGGITSPSPTWELISDPLPNSFEAPNGIIVNALVATKYSAGATVMYRTSEPDWYSSFKAGDHASDLDMRKWTPSSVSALAVSIVEAFYG